MFESKNGNKSLYDILEVSQDAPIDEIKESYARAKSTFSEENPALYGIMGGQDQKNNLNEIENAFKVLSDPETREQYDKKMGISSQKSSLQEDLLTRTFKQKNIEKNDSPNISTVKSSNDFEQQSLKKLVETNKYQLSYDIDDDLEKKIREATDFNGEFLKEIREYKKVTIEKMADMTRISKTNIRNLESENTDTMPATVYVRGFIYQYAKCLKLNPELVASSYMHQLKKKEQI